VVLRALGFAVEHNEPGCQAWALRLLGEILARLQSPQSEEVEAHFRRSLISADRHGMRPLQAHCHLGLGKLYRRIGRLNDAHAELATAVAMLREMGMTFWLPEAESELAALAR
jgi:hypothetical protein